MTNYMVIKDWKLLYGIFLILLPHIVNKHYLVILGTIFLSLAGCWLIGEYILDIKRSKQ